VTEVRFEELRVGILPLLTSVMPRTLGLFLLGAAASRANIVRVRPPWLNVFASSALGVGGLLSLLNVLASERWLTLGRLGGSVANTGSLLFGLGYAAAFLLASERRAFRHVLARSSASHCFIASGSV
jgi:hypothetical protein